jgi:hypothetical protein
MVQALVAGLGAQDMYQVTAAQPRRGPRCRTFAILASSFGMFAGYYVSEGTPNDPASVKAESADGAASIQHVFRNARAVSDKSLPQMYDGTPQNRHAPTWGKSP